MDLDLSSDPELEWWIETAAELKDVVDRDGSDPVWQWRTAVAAAMDCRSRGSELLDLALGAEARLRAMLVEDSGRVRGASVGILVLNTSGLGWDSPLSSLLVEAVSHGAPLVVGEHLVAVEIEGVLAGVTSGGGALLLGTVDESTLDMVVSMGGDSVERAVAVWPSVQRLMGAGRVDVAGRRSRGSKVLCWSLGDQVVGGSIKKEA